MAGALSRGQRDALYELVAAGELTEQQARAAVEAVEAEGRARDSARARNVLVEIAGYLGAALMLVGGLVLVSGLHDTLARPARVGVMVGLTIVFALIGAYLGGGGRGLRERARDPGVRARIVATLFALAALTAGTAVGIGTPDQGTLLPAVGTALVVALLGYLALPAVPGLLAVAIAAVAVVREFANLWVGPEYSPYHDGTFLSAHNITALALLALGIVWTALALRGLFVAPRLALALRGLFVAPRLALALGVIILLLGAHWPLGGSYELWSYPVLALVAMALLAGFARRRDPVLLVGGLIGAMLLVGEGLSDLVDSDLLGALIVVVLGAVLLFGGAVGMRRAKRGGGVERDTSGRAGHQR
ncbi:MULTISPECIES: DUF2157 domain-containing protein [unclassified Actinopolyspora]|uniref:DUF2157 domain-containing protein n=1 Tax=unclassified Actinopolyspora TaxID=2639451 RepID=UPI0013F62E8B|nr:MULTISPECIES: DUF2157 domain-containing protein [unclassified Actinopolyspora]NHD17621.1 hypothetical protein [Actinopolyspora sp. BKK2]NHE76646.1 hypothetical protein [Actinopolyspora sp. BKK1]